MNNLKSQLQPDQIETNINALAAKSRKNKEKSKKCVRILHIDDEHSLLEVSKSILENGRQFHSGLSGIH